MSDVIVRRAPVESPPPPKRRGGLLVAALAALIALVAVFDRAESGDESRQMAAGTTTTTAPAPPAIISGQTLLDSGALAVGPRLTWSEVALPTGVTAVHAIGELDGRPAIVATTLPPDRSGLHPGGAVYLTDATGRWSDPVLTMRTDEHVVTADIGTGGVVVVVAGSGAAQLPFEADEVAVHASADGAEWTRTELSAPGGDRLANMHAVAGDRIGPAWITALVIPDDYPQITARLPAPVRDLVRRGSAWVTVDGDRVSVRLPIGLPVHEATLAELGLDADDAAALGARRLPAAWSAPDGVSFVPVGDPPAGDQGIIAMVRGADGRLVVVDAGNEILVSDDGATWRSAGRFGLRGFGAAAVQSIGGAVVSIHNRTVSVVDGGSGEYVLAPPEGRGISPHVRPAAGPAGLVLATSANGPEYAVRIDPTVVESEPYTFVIDPADRSITVLDDSGVLAVVRSPDDDTSVQYLPETDALLLAGEYPLTIAELERAYLAALSPTARGPYGIAFSPDGVEWGWSPVVNGDGEQAGPVARLAVGETSVYAIIAQPSFPNTPIAALVVAPRLLVGMVGG